jgi:hypothetical protein
MKPTVMCGRSDGDCGNGHVCVSGLYRLLGSARESLYLGLPLRAGRLI